LKKKYDFKAHEGEIEDLDLSPGNEVGHFSLLFSSLLEEEEEEEEEGSWTLECATARPSER